MQALSFRTLGVPNPVSSHTTHRLMLERSFFQELAVHGRRTYMDAGLLATLCLEKNPWIWRKRFTPSENIFLYTRAQIDAPARLEAHYARNHYARKILVLAFVVPSWWLMYWCSPLSDPIWISPVLPPINLYQQRLTSPIYILILVKLFNFSKTM